MPSDNNNIVRYISTCIIVVREQIISEWLKLRMLVRTGASFFAENHTPDTEADDSKSNLLLLWLGLFDTLTFAPR